MSLSKLAQNIVKIESIQLISYYDLGG